MYFDMPWINFFTSMVLMIQLLSCFKQFVLFFAWICYSPDMDWPSMPEASEAQRLSKHRAATAARNYDMVVEYLYVNCLTHLVHLLAGLLILMMWFSVQLVCIMADMLYGLHSWFILNANLRSSGLCA